MVKLPDIIENLLREYDPLSRLWKKELISILLAGSTFVKPSITRWSMEVTLVINTRAITEKSSSKKRAVPRFPFFLFAFAKKV